MYYINTIASISHQDSFGGENIFDKLKPLESESEVISPNYKEHIPSAALRRLSPVLRMGLMASISCKERINKDFDAISVGTALGCLRDTEKFLVTIHTTTSDFLSPTAFIQSTHNTIGGQISLGLGNHAYNMTHTQNNLSFEVALKDALLCIDEGKQNVLVGAADEFIPFLELLQPNLIPKGHQLTSGASFYALSGKHEAEVGIIGVHTNFNCENVADDIKSFLNTMQVEASELDLLLSDQDLTLESFNGNQMNYLDYSGLHYSAPAFALHIAHDYLMAKQKQYALVVNELCPGKLGLTLIARK